jgi:hypothetical protein
MSAEWVTAIATAGTFVVIAASAIAALVQLRHMRGSNQIAVLTELRETMESREFQERYAEVVGRFRERMADREFRKQIMSERRLAGIEGVRSAVLVGNFFENNGVLVRRHIIDGELFCEMWGPNTVSAWNALEEFIANRRLINGPGLFENFEYLVLMCERHLAKFPHGTFPPNHVRKTLPQPWPESAEFADG